REKLEKIEEIARRVYRLEEKLKSKIEYKIRELKKKMKEIESARNFKKSLSYNTPPHSSSFFDKKV
ncbi:MAG: hypothetical protein DSY53_01010, partial [Persephonella sp.]